jgi:hypothetical protein
MREHDYQNDFSMNVFYKISAATDVAETWRRFGWEPPSQDPNYHEKWKKAKEPTKIGASNG